MRYSQRIRIVTENRRIAAACGYSCDGKQVTLPDIPSLAEQTLLLHPECPPQPDVLRDFAIADATRKTDTISCVLQLREEGITGEIIALNFANAMAAGGGYRLGGDAQEESLCRCSLLYPVLLRQPAYYWAHRLRPTPLYSHRMLLSPDVPVIRNMQGELLPEPITCTFLTCAAVNRYFAKLCLISEKRITAVMEQRLDGMMAVIGERKPAAVVLGAFGCGMFGNRRETILPLMEQAVQKRIPNETTVVFAQP